MDFSYRRGFIPYALCAFLIGLVGGFSTVLGPAFVSDLGIAYNATTWSALAQAISTAACAPILGKLGDRLGRRRTLLLGIFLFTLGNLLNALAPDFLWILAARFTVGLGTAAMAPLIMAYIVSHFPRDRVAKGFSQYMLISSASVVFGPTLGGLCLTLWGWRMLCLICAGISAAVLLFCLFFGQKEPVTQSRSLAFDWAGAVFTVLFFSFLLCLPAFGQNLGWNRAPFFVVLCLTAVTGASLILAEKRAKNPILPKALLTRKSFLLSMTALLFTQGLMQANMTNTVIFVRYIQPGNTLLSGYAISVMYLGMSLGAVLLGALADRYSPRRVLLGSFLLTGVGCGLMLTFSASAAAGLLFASLGLLGFGLGANGTIFMKIVLSRTDPAQAGAETGTFGLFRDLAAPFGVAVLVPLFTNRTAALISAGQPEAAAAVQGIHFLSVIELLCVGAGLAAVLCLPESKQGGALCD